MDQAHIDRVRKEMRQAGVTPYGMMKGESRYLPGLIQPDEHIGGVIYGHIGNLDSAMLVATNQRVIFLDKKFLFSTTDVITYNAISGVNRTRVGLFSSVVLHTKLGKYEFRYVNGNCALIFVKYVQSQRLQDSADPESREEAAPAQPAADAPDDTHPPALPVFQDLANDEALHFLKTNDLAVLSTVNNQHVPSAAMVYYQVDQDHNIYILTKISTSKAQNTLRKSPVALTVHEPYSMKTLQIQGFGEVQPGQKLAEMVYAQIMKTRAARNETSQIPIAKLDAGDFTVIKITIDALHFADYAK